MWINLARSLEDMKTEILRSDRESIEKMGESEAFNDTVKIVEKDLDKNKTSVDNMLTQMWIMWISFFKKGYFYEKKIKTIEKLQK